ncbi:cytochrome (ubi)quinol oxidase subunit III [Sulfobacillus harzensis]|uniref:Cytochrome (Ubi)quinol oxidase subunit III n=1 Tax=Sulfobacillus harzensis TaxID=2729629 RepID=A0A7Y0L5E1_9FIRM|nr:cytochrome (ubi)quinol oxidase subunit III [Sulfobacillus harzensis]NMP23272.1 cytochrome (ubi)quinol oxidase subunit III [Sulfobacillus harzensis]
MSATTTSIPPEFQDNHESIRIMGFWIFLTTDIVLFGSLFSVYAVFRSRVALGPTPHQLFTLGPVLAETLILLTSTFTCSLSLFSARNNRLKGAIGWLVVTLVLGASFVSLEIREFVGDVLAGHTWHQSAFLSGFFTLVGTHGSHVTVGIVWAIMLALQLAMKGLTVTNRRKLYTFALYWHFLDIVWIFLFSVVYLTGIA